MIEIINKKIQELFEIESEVNRFKKRLSAYRERLIEDNIPLLGCKESGALKRAAIDLKNELTRITK